jgi:hypothetical protein
VYRTAACPLASVLFFFTTHACMAIAHLTFLVFLTADSATPQLAIARGAFAFPHPSRIKTQSDSPFSAAGNMHGANIANGMLSLCLTFSAAPGIDGAQYFPAMRLGISDPVIMTSRLDILPADERARVKDAAFVASAKCAVHVKTYVYLHAHVQYTSYS